MWILDLLIKRSVPDEIPDAKYGAVSSFTPNIFGFTWHRCPIYKNRCSFSTSIISLNMDAIFYTVECKACWLGANSFGVWLR